MFRISGGFCPRKTGWRGKTNFLDWFLPPSVARVAIGVRLQPQLQAHVHGLHLQPGWGKKALQLAAAGCAARARARAHGAKLLQLRARLDDL